MNMDTLRDKYRKILKQEKEERSLDSGQLLLMSWLIAPHDPICALEFIDLAGDYVLEQQATYRSRHVRPSHD